MYRLVLAAAVAMSVGCAEIECEGEGPTSMCTDDDRPATIEYVTQTILAPACANAQCHSAFSNASGYRFDTVEHVQQSALIVDTSLVMPGLSEGSLLYLVLVRTNGEAGTTPRMPYDQPLGAGDIALVRRWIDEGADGLGAVTP
jgi:hypothetical protein